MSSGNPTVTTPPLTRDRAFLTFWAGETASLFGTQITMLALPLTAVLVLGSGAADVGLLRFGQMIPFLLFALPFGVWADRVPRRPLMIGANVLRLVVVGLVPVLYLADAITLPVLVAVAFCGGIGATCFDVSWMSYLPSLLPDRRQLVLANGRLFMSSASADAVGPSVGGLLVAAVGAPLAMAANAATFLVSIVSLLLIRRPERVSGSGQRRHVGRELADGVRCLVGNRYLREIALVGGVVNFFVTAHQTLFVVYAVKDLGISAGVLGLILSLGAAGGVAGAIAAGRVTRRYPVGRVFAVATTVVFVAPLLIPAARGPEPLRVATFVLAFVLSYAAMSVNNILLISIRQAITPDHLLGRMNAVVRMAMFGLGALGGPVIGAAAVVLGDLPALWLSASCSALCLIPLRWARIRRLPAIPEPEPQPAAR